MPVYSAKDVAVWLLSEAWRQRVSVSHMQLQKLLYYVQGYSLGMSGRPVFDDALEAWTHGPVVRSVYDAYKRYGAQPLPSPGDATVPDDIRPLIVSVVSQKGRLSATALRNATHNEAPWRDAEKGAPIDNSAIRDHFASLFWTSDEEDEYQPSFDSEEEERRYFLNGISPEDRHAVLGPRWYRLCSLPLRGGRDRIQKQAVSCFGREG